MFKRISVSLLSLFIMISTLASSNDAYRIASENDLIIHDFNYINHLVLKERVKIAIIGDFVHPEEFTSIVPNTREIENNGIDDDKNGYIDDYYGYDAHFENGRLNNPVSTGHENGIVSIVDAIISHYGITEQINIIPINVYNPNGRFDELRFKKMADAIDYALAREVKVISISQGISVDNRYSFQYIDDDYDKSMRYFTDALLRAKKQGAVVLGAVSNDSTRNHLLEPEAPANLDNVISVGNVDEKGILKSGYGQNVDIAYYGTDIFVWSGRCEDYVKTDRSSCKHSQMTNGFKTVSGSSFATPIVALSLALVQAAGAEIEMNETLVKRMHSSCAKKIQSKRSVISDCVFSPRQLIESYL